MKSVLALSGQESFYPAHIPMATMYLLPPGIMQGMGDPGAWIGMVVVQGPHRGGTRGYARVILSYGESIDF